MVGAMKSATGMMALCAAPWANWRSMGLVLISDRRDMMISYVEFN
jgi:hypothetical protein